MESAIRSRYPDSMAWRCEVLAEVALDDEEVRQADRFVRHPRPRSK
jgi:hypothetical protein